LNNACGILNVKPKAQPKKLQSWQAYHVLTYESKWNPDVNTAWTDYKNTWAAEHPNEKPPKNRFQIMVEFMKQKFEMETEDMKNRCEEYRAERQLKASSPDSEKSESAINTGFQK
jgi:hypothetical protein